MMRVVFSYFNLSNKCKILIINQEMTALNKTKPNFITINYLNCLNLFNFIQHCYLIIYLSLMKTIRKQK